MPYLNVAEVESALEAATLAYPTLCTRTVLPNASCEGRTTHVLRVRCGSRINPHGVLLIGGVHAREWGSSDILVSFVEGLLAAYTSSTGVTYGGKTFTAAQVQQLLNNIDLFIYPDVNPDGKSYSQTVYSMWRRNRCPIPASTQIGTDINRNFDFLWDFRTFFAPAVAPASDVPGIDTYHGPSAFSEPESRNVRHLLDICPQIRLLVDVHSYTELLLYPWGDDDDQSADPTMNFRNAAWDGQRGVMSAGYGEYVHATDKARWVTFCNRMNASLTAVRGRVYTVGQGFSTLYPTCGTSHCYAFSRHLVDNAKTKVDGLLIEWGQSFQPVYNPEMMSIIAEVSAALFEACIATDGIPKVTATPASVDFGRARVGTSKSTSVRFTNDGVRSASIVGVNIEASPDAPRFSGAVAGSAALAPGGFASVQCTFAPDAVRAFAATMLVDVRDPAVTWSDVVRVPLAGTGCAVARGACAAPVFAPMNFWQFLVFLIVAVVLLIFLILFIWLPGVACMIKQLQYRLAHWSEGNSDPCKTI